MFVCLLGWTAAPSWRRGESFLSRRECEPVPADVRFVVVQRHRVYCEMVAGSSERDAKMLLF